jgi:hypothetical protein
MGMNTSRSGSVPQMAPHKEAFLPTLFCITASDTLAPRANCVNESISVSDQNFYSTSINCSAIETMVEGFSSFGESEDDPPELVSLKSVVQNEVCRYRIILGHFRNPKQICLNRPLFAHPVPKWWTDSLQRIWENRIMNLRWSSTGTM